MSYLTRYPQMWKIAHWAQHWAPMIRSEDVRLSKPGVKLAVRMTTKDNLAISWTPHIPADAVVPDELRTWIAELHQPMGYNTPGNDLYFISDAGRLRDHLENGGDIGDPVLASLLVAALQHIIADLPRKLEHMVDAWWQNYLIVCEADPDKEVEAQFHIYDGWHFRLDHNEDLTHDAEAKTGMRQQDLQGAIEDITVRRPRLRRYDSIIAAIAAEQGINPKILKNQASLYAEKSEMIKSMAAREPTKTPHPLKGYYRRNQHAV